MFWVVSEIVTPLISATNSTARFFRLSCGLLVFSTIYTFNGYFATMKSVGMGWLGGWRMPMSLGVKRVTSSCASFRHICDGPVNAVMFRGVLVLFCFLTKQSTGKVVGEKSRKGRGLIKHQGKNRANNRQGKVKHIDLNTQEQGR